MYLEERKMNLFDLENQGYLFVHCISMDLALGAGIAKTFRDKYDMKKKLFQFKKQNSSYFIDFKYGFCVTINNVANLITKKYYYNKPTMKTMEESLISLKKYCIIHNVNKIAMPKIGCGLDRLDWSEVLYLIQKIFSDLNIEIIVCSI